MSYTFQEITNSEYGSPKFAKKALIDENIELNSKPIFDKCRAHSNLNTPEIVPPIDPETDSLIASLFINLKSGYEPYIEMPNFSFPDIEIDDKAMFGISA